MKKYTVELVRRITFEDVEASNAKQAQAKALSKIGAESPYFDVRTIFDQEAEEEVEICESCGGDILPGTGYSTSEDDGYSVCEKCTKEVQS